MDRMVAFYRDFLGLSITKRDANNRAVFFSAEPQSVDHEVALMVGRPAEEGPRLVQQISLRVPSFDDLRTYHRRLKAEGYQIDQVVTHLSAIGCYFFDPEGNRTEVFWLTGLPSWVMIGVPIDIERPYDEVMADIDRWWRQTRHVAPGEAPDEAAQEAMKRAYEEAGATRRVPAGVS
jgi:catechol-2,3-dioxygenase